MKGKKDLKRNMKKGKMDNKTNKNWLSQDMASSVLLPMAQQPLLGLGFLIIEA
jgi:hypothetical protein